MKNGIIVLSVAVAVVAAVFMLSPDSGDPSGPAPLTTTVGETEDLKALREATARQKAAEGEVEKPVPSASGPWPVAVAPKTTFEFGKMQVGAELEHVFVIRNDGDGPLNLQEGKSTCKCTKFELSKKLLQKGEEARLTVRWKGKFRDPGFRHGGPVYTDDPERTKIDFAVTGEVDNAVEILPAEVWSVGSVAHDQQGSVNAYMVSKIHKSFEITSVKCQSPFVTAEVFPISDEKRRESDALSGYRISVQLSPDIPPGPFESRIDLETDCLDAVASVVVTASKAGPIEIQQTPGVIWVPSANGLKLGQFSSEKGREVELVMVVNEEKLEGDLELTDIKATPSFIKAALTPAGKVGDSTGRYKLKISIPPGAPKSRYDSGKPARLKLTTNHPANENLTISISFRVF